MPPSLGKCSSAEVGLILRSNFKVKRGKTCQKYNSFTRFLQQHETLRDILGIRKIIQIRLEKKHDDLCRRVNRAIYGIIYGIIHVL